jgi:hypothetical protein
VHGSSSEKVSEWTRRLRRHEKSGQSVARFCRDEGVSQGSFYLWKKKLRDLLPGGCKDESQSSHTSAQFRPVHVASSLTQTSQQQTIVRLGDDIRIELGSDLAIVASVVRQLLASVADSRSSKGGESC